MFGIVQCRSPEGAGAVLAVALVAVANAMEDVSPLCDGDGSDVRWQCSAARWPGHMRVPRGCMGQAGGEQKQAKDQQVKAAAFA